MVELYGPAFLSAYGESPSPLWLAAISELTDDECREGLTALAKAAREYPANLTQFVAACRPAKPVRYLGAPTTAAKLQALMPPKAQVSVADRYLARMRAAVGQAMASERPKSPETKACTCRATGECEVCRSYAGLAGGDASDLRGAEQPEGEAGVLPATAEGFGR